ncbi:MAG: hypothetical protein U0519_03185 [Candidatus Gracilibacteria bacterium]
MDDSLVGDNNTVQKVEEAIIGNNKSEDSRDAQVHKKHGRCIQGSLEKTGHKKERETHNRNLYRPHEIRERMVKKSLNFAFIFLEEWHTKAIR